MPASAPRVTPGVEVVDSFVTGRTGHRVPVRDYVPTHVSQEDPMLWVHGGGFVSGDLDMDESDAVAREISQTGRPVRTVDYRLVPMFKLRGPIAARPSENRYPAPLHDVLDAYGDLASAAGHRRPLLGGASAGAALALSAALRLRDGDGPLPSALALVYGTFHGHPVPQSAEYRSRRRLRDRANDVLIGSSFEKRMNVNYGGSLESLDDPLVFPGGGDLHGLPPTLVLNADHDRLRVSGDRLSSELDTAGVETVTAVVDGSRHGFLDKPGSDAFRSGTLRLLAWLATR